MVEQTKDCKHKWVTETITAANGERELLTFCSACGIVMEPNHGAMPNSTN